MPKWPLLLVMPFQLILLPPWPVPEVGQMTRLRSHQPTVVPLPWVIPLAVLIEETIHLVEPIAAMIHLVELIEAMIPLVLPALPTIGQSCNQVM